MKITPQQRQVGYQNLQKPFDELYSSDRTIAIIDKAVAKFNITEEKVPTFINLVGDTILGFYKTTDLPRLFQSELGMSADESQRLMSELIEFLTPVIQREQQASNIKKEDIQKLAQTFEAANKNRPKEVVPEGKPEGVAPLRTMQGDMSRIHGYGAAARGETTPETEPVVQAIPQADLTSRTPAPAATPAPSSPGTIQAAVAAIPIKKVE